MTLPTLDDPGGLPAVEYASQSAERLSRLIATVKKIARSLELAEVLPEIIKDATQLLDAYSGDVLLADQRRGLLRVVAVHNFAEDMIGFEFPLGEGLSSQAMASRRPVMVPDYMAYPRRVNALDHYRFKSVLSVPLLSRDEAIGAINIHSFELGHPYSEDDVALLTAFADHAALAIENAQRYENEKRMVADLRGLNEVIRAQNERLSRLLAIQSQFTQQSLHGHGLNGLARRLAALLDTPVVIEDPFVHLLTAAGPDGRDCPEFATPSEVQRDPRFKASLASAVATRRPMPVWDSPYRVLAPLLAADEVLGHLSVLPNTPLTEEQLAAVELAATHCALELLRQRAAVETEARLRGDFVLDLISGNYRDAEALVARATFLGHNLRTPFELFVLDIDNFTLLAQSSSEREAVRLKQQWFEAARRHVAARSPQSLVAAQSDTLIVLLSRAPAADGGIGESPRREFAATLKRELAERFQQLSVSVAFGGTCRRPEDFRDAFETARAALDLMKNLGRTDQLLEQDDLGFYGLLLQTNDPDRLKSFARVRLQPLRDYDLKHRTQLLDTLRLYFGHGCQKAAAARAAFLHVNTLAYRLRRAEQVLAVDLRQPDHLLELQFAFRVLDVLDVWA